MSLGAAGRLASGPLQSNQHSVLLCCRAACSQRGFAVQHAPRLQREAAAQELACLKLCAPLHLPLCRAVVVAGIPQPTNCPISLSTNELPTFVVTCITGNPASPKVTDLYSYNSDTTPAPGQVGGWAAACKRQLPGLAVQPGGTARLGACAHSRQLACD